MYSAGCVFPTESLTDEKLIAQTTIQIKKKKFSHDANYMEIQLEIFLYAAQHKRGMLICL